MHRLCTYVHKDTAENQRIGLHVIFARGIAHSMIFDRDQEYKQRGNRHFWARDTVSIQ